MRKAREVIRLNALGLSQRQIALSCCIGQATVSEYLKAADQAGLKWPEIAEWGEQRLLEALAPARPAAAPPDTIARTRLRRRAPASCRRTSTSRCNCCCRSIASSNPDGYRYSRYCELYRRWLKHQDVALRHEHRAGEKLFVVYAGPDHRHP